MITRIKSFSKYLGESKISDSLQYHVNQGMSITESVYRPGSTAHIKLLVEARMLFEMRSLELGRLDSYLFETTDLGKTGIYRGVEVALDMPLEDFSIEEAKYQGREVELGRPMRGGSKKYVVYVKNPSTGNIKKIQFGDPGLSAKVSNPKARKSFAARHRCAEKKDRTMAGYWACRINRYAHLWGGKTYPGYW
jgi:hypothetical protein